MIFKLSKEEAIEALTEYQSKKTGMNPTKIHVIIDDNLDRRISSLTMVANKNSIVFSKEQAINNLLCYYTQYLDLDDRIYLNNIEIED